MHIRLTTAADIEAMAEARGRSVQVLVHALREKKMDLFIW